MSVPASISKFPEFVRSKTYEYLRTKGIGYIQQLAAEKWTDHNIHDPGITCLEMFCYAITDLGYKTDYLIEDILAESSTIDTKTSVDLLSNTSHKNTFYTPREILPCNPLTINDWRKVIIDIQLVKNAWLIMVEKSEPPIFRDLKADKLTYTPNNHTRRLNLDGLFSINLEFEQDDVLGDLNLWEYRFPLTNSELKFITLYFKPNWLVFFENQLDPLEYDHAYLGSFSSIEDTFFYQGKFYLQKDSLAVPFEVNIESPLDKTDANKNFIDNRISAELGEIGAFLQQRIAACLKTANKVEARIHQHRNLCEDLVKFQQTEIEEIGVCTDIEVSANADIEQILAEVYFYLEKFFSPTIPFYSLEELQRDGLCLDQIFNGPAMRHGFIKDEDLAASEYRSMVHVSDIIQILMDIEGIVAIKSIQLSKFFCGLIKNDGEEWCLEVSDKRALKLNIQKSKITFFKGLIPYKAKEKDTFEILEDLKAIEKRARLKAEEYDVAIKPGIDYSLQSYHSIQNDFPLVYGTGEEGLAPSSSDSRKAQAKQLKAFLSLFDQLLSNYCAQLGNVKNLFSLNSDIKRTYFSQPLFTMPVTYKITQNVLDHLLDEGWTSENIAKLEPLVGASGAAEADFSSTLLSQLGNSLYQLHKDQLMEISEIPAISVPNLPNGNNLVHEFVRSQSSTAINWDKPSSYADEWQHYLIGKKDSFWSQLCLRDDKVESNTTYLARKNRFLDHLLARFAEQFTDYVLLSSHMNNAKTSDELITDKISFLKDYPRMSHNRGKGFNCKVFDEHDNVTGLELRASKLVGIENWFRAPLATDFSEIFEVFAEDDNDGIDEWRFRLRDTDDNILFSSTKHYLSPEELQTAMESALECGIDRQQYKIKTNINGEYFLVLHDKSNDIIARRRKYYVTQSEVEEQIQTIVQMLMHRAIRLEGFHLVEHILLRPVSTGSDLFKVDLKADCSPGYQDPYSFRATAVVPYWPPRFLNMDFRRFFEETLRKEAPAHVHIKICWVDQETMANFEESFFAWLKLKTQTIFTLPSLVHKNQALIDKQNELLHILENLNSVYPETHLFDCTKEGDTQSILLNHSKLGSSKGN